MVRLDPAAPIYAVEQCLRAAGATRSRRIAQLSVSRLKVPAGRTAEAIDRLKACPGVIYAEPNYVVSAAETIPDDTFWSNQYGLRAIRAPQGWDLAAGSSAVTIAVVDSGVDLAHVDLAGKILPGYDFINNDAVPQDDFYLSHGTHVAGIAAAITDNGTGVAGVSWGARLLPVKVLDSSGNGTSAGVAEGITWAVDHGAQVINLSLGGPDPSTVLEDAVNYAYGQGVVVVAAAGNFGTNAPFYPASYAHVIAVAATDSSNNRYANSDFGSWVDLAAPGVSVFSTLRNNTYGNLTGTSMASPFVAGLAAILRGLPGNTSPDQIEQQLETTALDLGTAGRDDLFGYGLIQADAAIRSVSASPLLGVGKSGTGDGTVTSVPAGIDCGTACSAFFDLNASVTLTAVPAAGSTFTGWDDPACPGIDACTLTMDADRSVKAAFTADGFSLSVSAEHGTVDVSPDQPVYHYGDSVRLTAVPAGDFVFDHWSSDISGSANPLDVTIHGNTTVTANFVIRYYFPFVGR
jgi:thermitase